MAKAVVLFLSSLLFAFFTALSEIHCNINQWCDQTPFPQTCNQFLSQTSYNSSLKVKADFRKLATQVALNTIVNAVAKTNKTGKSDRDNVAWVDCMELFENTIMQLNKTLDPTIKPTDFDAQTWISAALTNLDTCRDGFVDLGVSDFVLPPMFHTVYQLICNTLALGDALSNKHTNKDVFPTWVPPRDRKHLMADVIVPNIVVAKDGSGNFRSINEALDATWKRSGIGRFVIHVRHGVYEEYLEIGKGMKNIMLVGDGIKNTIITGNRSVVGGYTTFKSATVVVAGNGFIARDITFRNTAGPQNHQAVALRSGSDCSVFYRCSFEGYQDTLYVHSQRQFYRECNIYGTIDFIFGNAAVVFQNCTINVRKPMNGQKNIITAQSRTVPNQITGISIHNSRVQASPELTPEIGSIKTYLGRPWRAYSRTIFMRTFLDSLIDPTGWVEWNGNFSLDTLYYAEYMNNGPGSSTGGRVKWEGYRIVTDTKEAANFCVANFIKGQSWLPATNVPFLPGV